LKPRLEAFRHEVCLRRLQRLAAHFVSSSWVVFAIRRLKIGGYSRSGELGGGSGSSNAFDG
jgi:hypothetical protein